MSLRPINVISAASGKSACQSRSQNHMYQESDPLTDYLHDERQRAADRNDNILGWEDVKHTDQQSGSMVAEYAPKKGKAVTASAFTQPGTPTEERRWESDKAWIIDGDRKNASIGNTVAGNDRDRAGIATKDWATWSQGQSA